jgi:hypothetical protein
MIPIVGLMVRAVDRFLAKSSAQPLIDRRTLLAYAAALIIAASLPDLAWGTFTFTVRAGMRLAILVGVHFVLTIRRTERETIRKPKRPGLIRTPSGRPPHRSRG